MGPSQSHFNFVRNQWGVEHLSYLQFSESYIYEGRLVGKPIIVRFALPNHRSEDEIRSELDWMNYLSTGGLNVASPIPSNDGNFVESVNHGSRFHITVFEKAPGKALEGPKDFSLRLFKEWGRYLGAMHRLTKRYQPSEEITPRAIWRNDTGFKAVLSGLDKNDEIPYTCFQELYGWLNDLEQDENCYGLVHADLHFKNFFIDGCNITAFDFDDSCYHWFSHDLAAPLHSISRLFDSENFEFSYAEASGEFLNGYSLENSLEQKWIDRIDLFLKFRICTVYHWIKGRKISGTIPESRQLKCDELLEWSLSQLQKQLTIS